MTEENQQTQENNQEEKNKDDQQGTESVEDQEEPVVEDIQEKQKEKDEQTAYIEQLQKEKDDYKSRMLRIQADYDNFRRRTKDEKATEAKFKAQSLAERLLPALDNFERALNVDVEGSEAQSLLEGMDMVYRQVKEAFESENIREISAEGQPFDPQFHQAVSQADDENAASNTVVEVMQKGYMLNDRVIRPAMVKVAN